MLSGVFKWLAGFLLIVIQAAVEWLLRTSLMAPHFSVYKHTSLIWLSEARKLAPSSGVHHMISFVRHIWNADEVSGRTS